MTDFVVLTGFLGSGKTTLLRDFLSGPESADTAVIVNEAGEIGLDGVILNEGGGETPIAMLSNGCICCQAGSDLAFTIDDIRMAAQHKRPTRNDGLVELLAQQPVELGGVGPGHTGHQFDRVVGHGAQS